MVNCKHCGIGGHHTGTCKTMSGQRFGSLVVLRGAQCRGKTYLLCKCDCGVEKEVRIDHLRKGATTSCGCNKVAAGQIRDRVDPAKLFVVFGEQMTLGEVAEASGKRPDQIWRKVRRGESVEIAAFGKGTAAFIEARANESNAAPTRSQEQIREAVHEERLANLEAAVRRVEASVATMRAAMRAGATS